ncbi:hypothetical protein K469DRAFT_689767 [Zopfia rhizophila CBS 207.26]|uniref:Uncharacterized protein n=1 Tax=Zopfia rhizophila CBS 207.26 TaxID=1314779 RepID=A0A6A6DVA3_9PEZI|nr:hypothetical protein K469DRAFT_689767 [Zopfia rhizophila CBS 207.26]
MLQEIHPDALGAILADGWIKEHFLTSHALSNDYIVMMLVTKNIPTQHWFQISFGEGLGRKALFVDIPLAPQPEDEQKKEVLRLCTTRLASLKKTQFAAIHLHWVLSQLRKPPTHDISVRGGLIGGHLDFIFRYIGARNSSSFIIWHDADPITSLSINLPSHRHRSSNPGSKARAAKSIQSDALGSEPELQLPPKRSYKFLATGRLELSGLDETKDPSVGVSRIGVGLKTTIRICEPGGPIVKRYAGGKDHSINNSYKRNKRNVLVSRQFGLAVRLRAYD